MPDFLKKVNDVIEEALTEKTFNLEIVGKIKEIRDEITRLQGENERLVKDQKDKGDLIVALNNRNNQLSEREQGFDKREEALYASEKELYKKEQTAANETAKLNLAVDLFKTVFRNTEVRSEMFKNEPIINNGYSQGTASGSETKTERKE